MNHLTRALQVLCEELGLRPPAPDARGRYALHVGEFVLRLAPWGRDEAVLEGIIGSMGQDAARDWENQQDVLRQVLTWNIARLKGLARPEVLSFDEEENLLLLWRTWPCGPGFTTQLLQGAEDMLNELEFWRAKLQALTPSFNQRGVSP